MPFHTSHAAVFATLALGLAVACGASRVRRNDAELLQVTGGNATASTVHELLCGNFVGYKKWSDASCSIIAPTCQMFSIKCADDERVDTVTMKWHMTGTAANLFAPRTGWKILDRINKAIGKQKIFRISRTATPVTTSGETYRFFLESENCSKADSSVECDLPWPSTEPLREAPEEVALTHFYLLVDKSTPGHPAISVEVNQYVGEYSASSFEFLGTGVQAPLPQIFAGSTGTGCGVGLPCGKPPQLPRTPNPNEKMVWNVTSRYLMEYPVGSGQYQLKTDTNFGEQQKTRVYAFKEDDRMS